MIQGISDKPEGLAAGLAQGSPKPMAEAPHVAARQETPAPPPPNPAQEAVNVSDPGVAATVEKVNAALQQQSDSRLSLAVDKETNRVVVRYKDSQSGEVVRQYPADTILKMAKQLDKLKGAILDSKG